MANASASGGWISHLIPDYAPNEVLHPERALAAPYPDGF